MSIEHLLSAGYIFLGPEDTETHLIHTPLGRTLDVVYRGWSKFYSPWKALNHILASEPQPGV